MDAIVAGANEESFGAGNFIGMMLKLYDEPDSKGLQDAVPFVWGADDLTQYAERSGVEKHKLYRDQFICGAIMEMLIAHLSSTKQTQKEKLVNILRQMRMGADRDQKFWFSDAPESNRKIEFDPTSINHKKSPVLPFDKQSDRSIRAAHDLVRLGKKEQSIKHAPYTPHTHNTESKSTNASALNSGLERPQGFVRKNVTTLNYGNSLCHTKT